MVLVLAARHGGGGGQPLGYDTMPPPPKKRLLGTCSLSKRVFWSCMPYGIKACLGFVPHGRPPVSGRGVGRLTTGDTGLIGFLQGWGAAGLLSSRLNVQRPISCYLCGVQTPKGPHEGQGTVHRTLGWAIGHGHSRQSTTTRLTPKHLVGWWAAGRC